MGKGDKLRFVDDPDTNTLVVSGATGEQLRTIGELIELWDVPEPVNKRKTRFTRLVKVELWKGGQDRRDRQGSLPRLVEQQRQGVQPVAAGSEWRRRWRRKEEATKSRNGSGSGFAEFRERS